LYGASTALAFVALRRGLRVGQLAPARGALLRGGLAGLVCGWLLGLLLDAQGQVLAFATMMTGESHRLAWLVVLGVGALAGIVYALLYPRPADGAGAGLVRGTLYGVFWWVAGGLTILPLAGGSGLAWSL